ncbi:collagen alpha-2(VIII) chain-like [Mercenaria mercenaria]|uniref:collagen alpha-2(VIII) chain-like n=1 Tax=Mercenaria mercenaria TaxID=6596 RepID=UPI00234E6AAC|nr:collagen alpha-2(VIII) chain-like [Mercenaria mercenaria]
MDIFIFLIFAATIEYKSMMVAAKEPACSKFDFEEKLLEKVIRLEIKVEQIVEEMKKTTTDVEQRVENAENDAVKFQEDIKKTMNTMEKKFTAFEENISAPNIAFNARRTSSLNANKNDLVVFDTVILNEGEGYDSATGIFTAPESGLYDFAAHVCIVGGKGANFAIVVEGTEVATSSHYSSNNNCNSVTAVAKVKSEERVSIKILHASYLHYDQYRLNSFAGALLTRH